MNIIDFFGKHVKPHSLKGSYKLHPHNTSEIANGISCIREYDVNFWFYKKNNTIIAFDSGYKNFGNLDKKFAKIKISPKDIKAVFLTHADIDHAGGIDINSKNIYPNAEIYVSELEKTNFNHNQPRFKKGPIKIYNSIELAKNINLVEDRQIIFIDDIKIECLSIPGHTMGHMCYIVDDKILISGDSLAINQTGGYCFFELFNMNSEMNISSLHKMQKITKDYNLEMVCTGHNGYSTEIKKLYEHIDEIAKSTKKHPFDSTAPYDLFN